MTLLLHRRTQIFFNHVLSHKYRVGSHRVLICLLNKLSSAIILPSNGIVVDSDSSLARFLSQNTSSNVYEADKSSFDQSIRRDDVERDT